MNKIGNRSFMTKMQTVTCIVIIASVIAISAYLLKPSDTVATPFNLKVFNRPRSFGEIVYTIPRQKCIFLVIIEENQTGTGAKAVKLSATASGCNATIFPQAITRGQVAELMVVPSEANLGKNVTITLQGERDGLKKTMNVTVEVIEWEDTLEPEAVNIRNNFTQWLSTNRPELGITNETLWMGTMVNPRILVVMHYMFLSKDWEMYVTWHVMIPPYDWARIYLRHRFNGTAPSYAFEISSIQGKVEPQVIEIPDWV